MAFTVLKQSIDFFRKIRAQITFFQVHVFILVSVPKNERVYLQQFTSEKCAKVASVSDEIAPPLFWVVFI